jgi:hypothetical protein
MSISESSKQQDNHFLYHLNKKAYLCLFAPSFGLKSRTSCRVPRSVPRPACRPPNAHRYLPANAWGTLLPPSPPEPQRGHPRTRKSLATQLASTAELPLKITAELHPTPHKKIRQPQFGSVTLRSPIILSFFLSLSFIAK